MGKPMTMKLLLAAAIVASASAISNCALCLHIVETKGEFCKTLTTGANSTGDAETAGLCNNMLLAMRNHCPAYEGSCKHFIDTKPMQARNDYVKGAGWAADYDAGKCPPTVVCSACSYFGTHMCVDIGPDGRNQYHDLTGADVADMEHPDVSFLQK